MGEDLLASFMNDYFAEADEHLSAVRRNLLVLEPAVGQPHPPAAVLGELFRNVHSLKGISAMVDLREAERLAHAMESCLGAVRDGRRALEPSIFDAIVDGTRLLERVVGARRAHSDIPPVDDQVRRLASWAELTGAEPPARTTPASAAAPAGSWRITFTPSPALVARGVKVDTIRAQLAEMGRIESASPRVTSNGGISFEFVLTQVDDSKLRAWTEEGVVVEPVSDVQGERPTLRDTPPPADPALAPAMPPASFVRVDLARLDELMRLIGELVISRARLEELVRRIEPGVPALEWRPLQQLAESIDRQITNLRDGVMHVRLVPVAEIFRRMPFVIRDLARDDGKRVRLEMSGQGTEVDKFLIEQMMDPVLHLVRNAVSHGIEPPEERVAAGKPPEGTIRLAASTAGEMVLLEVSDDGRGMDAAGIISRARAAGLIGEAEDDAASLLDAICTPGFSTRKEADRASGRGVGMAVVRDAVQEVGGTLSAETAAGRGTTFRARLPLTLAITDAFIVQVGAQMFAVPQSAVFEVREVDAAAVRALEHHELIPHRGGTLPVIRLASLFGIGVPARPRFHALVVGTGTSAVAVIVDRIAGQREVVVKAVRDPLLKVPGVSGATELGDGRLVLILDLVRLVRANRDRSVTARAAG